MFETLIEEKRTLGMLLPHAQPPVRIHNASGLNFTQSTNPLTQSANSGQYVHSTPAGFP